jgi:hypothetical protein
MMASAADRHSDNAAFLADAVAWVRSRLLALVPAAVQEKGKKGKAAVPDPRAPAKKARKAGDIPTLLQLAQKLDLSPFEQDVLLLCTAAALDMNMGRLCAAASGEHGKPYPTFALAMRAFDAPAWDALAPSGALRRWRLIEIHQAANEPLLNSALRADERIVHYLKGLNHIDDRVANWIRPLASAPQNKLPPSHLEMSERIVSFIAAEEKSPGRPLIQLLGPEGTAKRDIAADVSARTGVELWRLAPSAITELGSELDAFSRLLLRETILIGAALYVDCDGEFVEHGPALPALLVRFLDRLDEVLVFLAIGDPVHGIDQAVLHQYVGKPTTSEQRSAWIDLIGAKRSAAANRLAGQFNLDFASIGRTVAMAGSTKVANDAELWRRAREEARPRVPRLAERILTTAGWDNLVLPEEQKALLKELAAQVPQQWTVYQEWGFAGRVDRGLGIGAMFCGGSGTGKNLAAEVVAHDIGLDLYRIDLASVVNKYIGETEKNLRRVFDAFEDGGAILFFDEADALFGKRTEVKDSHDRYANIEINYLLQRIEAYRGLVILATNRRSALDSAFLRRLRFIIEFPFPAAEERAAIWARVFPSETPCATLDVARLGRLPLSGGNIQSVALNAAFRAASADRKVDMEIILSCARNEMMKLELPIDEADFRPEPEIRRST